MRVSRFGLVAIAATAVILTACSTGAATNAPSQAAPGQSVPASSASEAPASAAPSVGDLGNSANALSNLTSYKVTTTITGGSDAGSATIVYVKQPTVSESFTGTFGGHTFAFIQIGSTLWVDAGTGTYTKTNLSPDMLKAQTAAFDPSTYLSAINKNNELSALTVVGVEQKNGVNAVHLHGDQNTKVPAGSSPIPAGATVDLWVSTDNQVLVALEANGFSSGGSTASFQVEVTNINDPSLTVTAPPS